MERLEVREHDWAKVREKRGGAGRSGRARAPGSRWGCVVTVGARTITERKCADGGGGGRMFEKTNVSASEGGGAGRDGAWNHHARRRRTRSGRRRRRRRSGGRGPLLGSVANPLSDSNRICPHLGAEKRGGLALAPGHGTRSRKGGAGRATGRRR